MSRRLNSGAAHMEVQPRTADVQELFETCDVLPQLLAGGVFAFLSDRLTGRDFLCRQLTPSGYRLKSGVACAFRLLSVECRKQFDTLAIDWMETAKMLTEIALVAPCPTENLQDYERYVSLFKEDGNPRYVPDLLNLTVAFERVSNHLATLFHGRSAIVKSILQDIGRAQRRSWPRCATLHISADVVTFMCMLTGRCQVHGPRGCKCSNVCNLDDNSRPPVNKNFTLIKMPGGKYQTVYARKTCVESMSIHPRALWGNKVNRQFSNGAHVQSVARAMMRTAGVRSPYSPDLISKALLTAEWEGKSDQLVFDEVARMCMASETFDALFVTRQPFISYGPASLQQLLGLSDQQVQAALTEVARKDTQLKDRDDMVTARIVLELCEDVDVAMQTDPAFPFNSIEELGRVCAGMADSIRVAIRVAVAKKASDVHALEILEVDTCMRKVKFFMTKVLACDHELAKSGNICSSEAYTWMSDIHHGVYWFATDRKHQHCQTYSWLRATKAYLCVGPIFDKDSDSSENMTARCQCMRFFDALDASSLMVAHTDDKRSSLPLKWMLSNKHATITFESKLVDHPYECIRQFVEDVGRLIERLELDVKLPRLFSKLEHTMGTAYLGHKGNVIKQWFMKSYALLVEDPRTRCAAMDLLGLRPNALFYRVLVIRHSLV